MGAHLRNRSDKLLSFGPELETVASERIAALERENESLTISVAQAILKLSALNVTLSDQAAELGQRNLEIMLCGKMNGVLQSSATAAEAYSVIVEVVTQLFPKTRAPSLSVAPRATGWKLALPGARYALRKCL